MIRRPTVERAQVSPAGMLRIKFSNGAQCATKRTYPWVFVMVITAGTSTSVKTSAKVYKGTSVLKTAQREAAAARQSSARQDKYGVENYRLDYICLKRLRDGRYVESNLTAPKVVSA